MLVTQVEITIVWTVTVLYIIRVLERHSFFLVTCAFHASK